MRYNPEYAAAGEPWLPCEYEALRAVWASGGDDFDVSERLKRSPDACRVKRFRLRLVTTPRVRKRCRAMDERLLTDLRGLTHAAAAAELGVSEKTVWTWRKRLGIPPPRRYMPPIKCPREEQLLIGRMLLARESPRVIAKSLNGYTRGKLAGLIYRHAEKLMALARAQSASGPLTGGHNG